MPLSEEEIIRKAFAKGEEWGVTYADWFDPSAEYTEQMIQEAIKEIVGEKK